MNILRKLGVSLCAGILTVTLLGLAWSSVGLATIRNRGAVKGWLDKSNFYNQVVDVVLEKVKGSGGNGETDISVNDLQIQAVAKQAFSPDFLKKNVETVLDSGYAWADGTNNKIAFSIDLTAAKQQLAAGLGDYARNKATTLPLCTPAEVTQDFDIFKATCQPAGLSPEQAGQKVTSDLLTSKEFLAKPVLTVDDLKPKDGSSSAQNVPIESTDQAKAVRQAYRLSGYVPLALGAIALVTAFGVIFLSADHFRGLRRVGWVFVTSGLVLLVTYILLGVAASMVDRKVGEAATNPAQNKLIGDVARVVIKDVQKALLPYVVGLTGGGIILALTGGKLTKRRDNANKKEFEGHKDMLPEPTHAPIDEKSTETDAAKEADKPVSKKDK